MVKYDKFRVIVTKVNYHGSNSEHIYDQTVELWLKLAAGKVEYGNYKGVPSKYSNQIFDLADENFSVDQKGMGIAFYGISSARSLERSVLLWLSKEEGPQPLKRYLRAEDCYKNVLPEEFDPRGSMFFIFPSNKCYMINIRRYKKLHPHHGIDTFLRIVTDDQFINVDKWEFAQDLMESDYIEKVVSFFTNHWALGNWQLCSLDLDKIGEDPDAKIFSLFGHEYSWRDVDRWVVEKGFIFKDHEKPAEGDILEKLKMFMKNFGWEFDEHLQKFKISCLALSVSPKQLLDRFTELEIGF